MPQAQLNLVTILSVDNDTPNEGSDITYQIRVTNNGPSTATNVKVRDAALPTGVIYDSDDSSGDFDEPTGIWSIGTLAPGGSKTLHITAKVASGQAGNTINNTIAVYLTERDATTTGDVLSVDLTVNKALLNTTITVDNPSPNEGDTVKYTITASNTGPNSATGIIITDLLPSGVTYVSDTGSGSYK